MSLNDMNLYDSPLQLARLRQEELQALANQQPDIRIAALRARLGDAIARFGHRVARSSPNIATEPASEARPGLAQP